jgi:hypothetical protein
MTFGHPLREGFMNRSFVMFALIMGSAVAAAARLGAAAEPPAADSALGAAPAAAAAGVDEAMQLKIEQKAGRIVESLKLDDADKAARVRAIAGDWLGKMLNWHKAHDPELGRLWGEWNKARSIVPKDEFPGEVIAHQIDDVYASLKPVYEDYITRLSAEVSAEQVDAIKESWSRSPGMTRTYNAYLEIVPDLAAKDKEVIKSRMLMAREAAMMTDSDKEIVAIYKRHKVKVEQYVGTLEWSKLHKAFAERGKAQADEKKQKNTEDSAGPAAAPAK